ncbi:ribonuclease T2 [Blastomonas natatoria]|uniref:Ribonuclease T2 n=1 Tax=Blastomonas natatoria TaxID=34015 RepID=A0A2V3V146_9SPHN|nr:ribonuclease T2 [Blastomonas natatoria]PXW74538.1 ribonuclease T2 [Blastomonas natatoria]
MRRAVALIALGVAAAPAPLLAQAYQCRMPEKLALLPQEKRGRDAVKRVVPVAGYTLALSWSPEFCRGREEDRGQALQCSRRFGEFGFVLHGLWPEGKTAVYPQYCATPPSPVPLSVVRQNLCAMPSQRLIQHQWDKHGSCMTRDPARYFQTARQLYQSVKLPDMERLSRRPLTQGMLRREIARLNPGMPASAIAIRANGRGWLQEVRLCLGMEYRPRACPAHVRQQRGDTPLKIWRGL